MVRIRKRERARDGCPLNPFSCEPYWMADYFRSPTVFIISFFFFILLQTYFLFVHAFRIFLSEYSFRLFHSLRPPFNDSEQNFLGFLSCELVKKISERARERKYVLYVDRINFREMFCKFSNELAINPYKSENRSRKEKTQYKQKGEGKGIKNEHQHTTEMNVK